MPEEHLAKHELTTHGTAPVTDEDLLSLHARHNVEAVGSALGLVFAVALVFKRLRRTGAAPSGSTPAESLSTAFGESFQRERARASARLGERRE